jgi:hypothetical protein
VVQGGANLLNSGTDTLIGAANLLPRAYNNTFGYLPRAEMLPYIPAYDWSYNLAANETEWEHRISRAGGDVAVAAGSFLVGGPSVKLPTLQVPTGAVRLAMPGGGTATFITSTVVGGGQITAGGVIRAGAVYNLASDAPKGGPYDQVRASNKGGEVHHTPAGAVTPYGRAKGPSVWMETSDHRRTASWGSSKAAQAYRKRQADLIRQGKVRDAIQMDIDDIRSKFGSKYDEHIREMLAEFGFSE